MERVFVFSPDPVRMTALSEKELPNPDRPLHDLASWMRYLWQQQADLGATMLTSLKEVIDGLANLRFRRLSETISELDFEFRFGDDVGTGESISVTVFLDFQSVVGRAANARCPLYHPLGPGRKRHDGLPRRAG